MVLTHLLQVLWQITNNCASAILKSKNQTTTGDKKHLLEYEPCIQFHFISYRIIIAHCYKKNELQCMNSKCHQKILTLEENGCRKLKELDKNKLCDCSYSK